MNTKTTQKHLKKGIILFILIFGFKSFSQTFDWENAVDNGDNATQTVSGVTVTVTTNIVSTETDNISVLNFFNNGSGTSGNSVCTCHINNSDSMTFTFSSPINISTIFAYDADRITGNTWTFTPTGGNNTTVIQAIANDFGSTITVNWTDVTAFTITSAQVNDTFGVDNINFETTLSADDVNKNAIEIYPNPTSNYISIKGLQDAKQYKVFDTTGKQILEGVISEYKKVNIKKLPKGLFFIKIENKDVFKFIKM